MCTDGSGVNAIQVPTYTIAQNVNADGEICDICEGYNGRFVNGIACSAYWSVADNACVIRHIHGTHKGLKQQGLVHRHLRREPRRSARRFLWRAQMARFGTIGKLLPTEHGVAGAV